MANRKKRWLSISLCLLLLLIVGCQNTQEETDMAQEESNGELTENQGPQQGGNITLSMRKPQSLNPLLNTEKTADETLKLVFDTLIDFDETNKVVPHIAKTWTMSEEGTILDIQLNNHINWHDGTPVTAKDVVFSLKTIEEASDSAYKACVKNIVSYKEVADDMLRIVYKEPFAGYATTLYFPVIPHHIENLENQLVGTGPYMFEEVISSKHMKLKHNPNYFKGSPNIEHIEVLFTPDAESDLHAFDQTIIDVVSTDVIDWEKHAKDKKSTIHEYMTMYYDYIGVNFSKPLLQDINLRQGLLYATNRDYLLEKIYLYHGEVTDGPVPSFSWLYNPEATLYNPDVKKAKTLIDGKTATIELLVNKENAQRQEVAAALVKMYKDIGVTLEVVEVEKETFMDRLAKGQFDLYLGGWKLSVIPDLSFAFHSQNIAVGANYGSYASSEMDQLLKDAFSAQGDEEFQAAYAKLQMHISKYLPYISLYFRSSALITNEKIKGDIKPHHMNIYQNIHEWYVTQ